MAGQDQAPKAVGQKATVREIEEAREDLARTIDAIAEIVSPANVARRTAGKFRQRAQSRVQSVDPRPACVLPRPTNPSSPNSRQEPVPSR
jgi:hypothetical protein